jgi:antitoxin component YwqK of YwqJK toxin-antitoxin module
MSAQNYNQFDENNKRHGVWKKTFENSNVLRYEGQFNHGKPVGLFNYYEAINNEPVLVAKRVFNKIDTTAEVTFFTSKGNVMGQGRMNNKTYIGEWLYYHKDSKQLMTQEFYNDKGELNGIKKVYYLSGKLAETTNYVNGKLQGESIAYSEKGKILRLETYKDNKFHGLYKTYDLKGNLTSEGNYFNDTRKGIWKFYKDGQLIEEKDLTKKSKNPYKNRH